MSWIRRFLVILSISIFSIVMLEIGAKIILALKNDLSAVQDDFVFKQVKPDGSFSPTKDFVLPIHENFKFRWISNEFNVEVRTNSFGLREDFEVKLSEIDTVFLATHLLLDMAWKFLSAIAISMLLD